MSTSKEYDFAIVGGGITGLGIALRAVEQGYSVVLFEKDKVSQKSSANSLRIMHGGLRYLQTLDFKRSLESIKAQYELLQRWPDHVVPLKCVMPLEKIGLKSKLPMSCASLLYRFLQRIVSADIGKTLLSRSKVIRATELSELIPFFKGLKSNGAFLWHDAVLKDPLTFAQTIVEEIREKGGVVLEDQQVQSINEEAGIIDVQTISTSIRCSKVINTVSWQDELGLRDDVQVNHAVGFNIIVRNKFLSSTACGLQSPDRRLFFLTPRGDQEVAIGTGYHACSMEKWDTLKDEVVGQFLNELNLCFNHYGIKHSLTESDVLSVEAGVLPAKSGVDLYGSPFVIRDGSQRHVINTKYTTFMNVATLALR